MSRSRFWLSRLLPAAPVPEHDDFDLGSLTWDPRTESWLSRPLMPDGRLDIKIDRHARSPVPTEDCLRVGREIARDPEAFERLIHSELAYAAAQRPQAQREHILRLRVRRIVLRSEPSQVVGDALLDGAPPFDNWYVWLVNGSPRQVVQQWE